MRVLHADALRPHAALVHNRMLCDTNILIEYLKGDSSVVTTILELQQARQPPFVSVVTITEILAYPPITPHEYAQVTQFLSAFIPLSISAPIAHRASLFKRQYHLSLGDAFIAATAEESNLPLITRDRDFQKVREITVRAI